MNAFKPKIIMVAGPTAVGKTATGIQLAQDLAGEIINADAFQVYRGMDIGTAKPTATELAAVPHHLINILTPGEPYSVAKFVQLAGQAINDIEQRGRIPILVGGTGFYLNALRLGLPLGTAGSSPERRKWQAFVDVHGAEAAWAALQQRDPVAARKIPVANVRRTVRALEVIDQTGHRFSEQPAPSPRYTTLVVGLTTERQLLYQRINARVEAMVAHGLVAEVRAIIDRYGTDNQALAAIGYKELVPYFAGEYDLATAVSLIQRNSRRYAKRQLTYLRNQMAPDWYDLVTQPQTYASLRQRVAEFINGIGRSAQ
ncbi:tRNA (adenosine(37)-N6)-dimethylallyltransferase MiaA [Lacticaseibacillus thailandensis]|nr:tRNA (adenosine(37)-N6)-dimethylallyltransferase MiaA [Lacticaseibacillus thailandensis]